jgi:syntaxin 18
MDITAIFASSLSSHKSASKLTTHAFDLAALNSFLQEAYRINAHITDLTRYLRSIRAPYLALGSHRPTPAAKHARTKTNGSLSQAMSDADRKRIETDTKTLLTTLSSAIRDLSSAATADDEARKAISERTRSKRGFGALGGTLGRWAAGTDGVLAPARTAAEKLEEDKQEGIRIHREGVLWFLQRRLEAAGEVQRDMVAVRLQRAVERNKSVMYRAGMELDGPARASMNISHSKGIDGQNNAAGVVEIERESSQQQSLNELLSPEQIQMFEKEQDSMVKFYNSELQKIKFVVFYIFRFELLLTISQLGPSNPLFTKSPRYKPSSP